MNALFIAVIAITTPLVLCYDEKYDKMDVDKILGDETLFNAYIECLLDKGPCSAEYAPEFRQLLPEVIATSCAKCSPIQRQHVRKTVKALQDRKPEEFKKFCEKYDPKHEYEQEFAAFLVKTD